MQFGVKQGEAPAYDSDKEPGSYIKYFKDNETRLRFLEPVNQWTEVWMHFSQSKSRDYPCTGDRATCPGCNHSNEREAKASKRYIVNAFNPTSGYVDLWKIPASIIDDLLRHEANEGTISNRDYTILKFQKDGGTKYGVDKEDRDNLDLSEHKEHFKDHQEALAEAFREVWGGLPDEPEYTGGELYEIPSVTLRKVEKKAPEPAPARSGWPSDDPPSEPAAQSDEGQQEITEAQLRNMSEPQVIEVFKIARVPVPKEYEDKDELIDRLIAALS